MKLTMRRAITGIGVLALPLMLTGCASLADRLVNRTILSPPYAPGFDAKKLHRSLFVVDLHADTLLWNRDLLERASHGHVDLPRLREGNVGLQVLGVVTRMPLFLKLDGNSDSPDVITGLIKLQDWPAETHSSRMARAVYQGEKLKDRISESGGALKPIANQRDLTELLEERAAGKPVIGVMLMLEGTHALEGDLANLDRLYAQGFRIIGLAHFFDNDMSGSAHGKRKEGLTPLGRQLVERCQALGMVIDLAHASVPAIEDTLAISKRPVIVSHTGVRGTCDTVRNLSDGQLRSLAASGSVIGIGLFKYATCGKTLEDTVKAMRYVADLVGVQHVGLGSDWDGSTTVVDASGLTLLTEAMLRANFTPEEIAAIMGGNALRVFRQTLPEQ
jgi:microsomal dipeptidase-like Zn-dependent dipeptidase